MSVRAHIAKMVRSLCITYVCAHIFARTLGSLLVVIDPQTRARIMHDRARLGRMLRAVLGYYMWKCQHNGN